MTNDNTMHGTTILSVRTGSKVAIGGDGQVSLGHTIIKSTATKIREINYQNNAEHPILAGFAGATADAFTLLERLENKLQKHPNQLKRSCVELAKDWRMDKYLRRLNAMMIVVDKENTLVLTGNGDVLSPEDGIAAIGSGGNYALAAAKAISLQNPEIDPEYIVKNSLQIASDICVYTNNNFTIKHITF